MIDDIVCSTLPAGSGDGGRSQRRSRSGQRRHLIQANVGNFAPGCTTAAMVKIEKGSPEFCIMQTDSQSGLDVVACSRITRSQQTWTGTCESVTVELVSE